MIDKLIIKKYLAKDLIHNSVLTKSARDVNHLNTQIREWILIMNILSV